MSSASRRPPRRPDDPRHALYGTYVSRFKGDDRGGTGGAAYHRLLPRLETVLDALRERPALLDIGCGGGQLLQALSERRSFSRAIGIDLSPEQVAVAREQGVDAEVADAVEYLKGHEESFDLITAVDFVEHLRKDELLTLAGRVHRALRPGGCFFVQTPNGQGLFAGSVIYGDLTHETILCPGSLVQLFRHAGLVDAVVEEAGPVGRARGAWWLLRRFVTLLKRIESGKTQRVWTQNMIGLAFRPILSTSIPDPSNG